MKVLDSSVWIEHLTNGPRSLDCTDLFKEPDEILVSAIIVYEVGRYIRRTSGLDVMEEVHAHMRRCQIRSVDSGIAVRAISVAADHRIPMADALIAATAELAGAELFSFDADLLQLEYAREPGSGKSSKPTD